MTDDRTNTENSGGPPPTRRGRGLRGPLRAAEQVLRRALGLTRPEPQLVRDAQAYWERPAADDGFNFHWRGSGLFAGDDARWLAVGREPLEAYRVFAAGLGFPPPRRVIEWGSGGGAVAVHFAPLAEAFAGVDLSADSLAECGRQLAEFAPRTRYTPVLVTADAPEAACEGREGTFDLFVCAYVFELLPTPEYGRRVLRVARRLLRDGGMAVVQIKYRTASAATAPRPWNYVRNLAQNTTYAIDEFWRDAAACGLTPRLVTLVPDQPLVRDERYAYFALVR
jgi:SAM-dependent methyltransferase